MTPDFSHEPLHILNLKDGQISALPGSEGLLCPRWSPDGRYLAAATNGQDRMMLFAFQSKEWQEVADFPVSCANWSTDGRYIYLRKIGVEAPGLFRLRISDGKLEQIADLRGFRGGTERLGGQWWSGLTPENSPLLLRDRGSQEIYSLEWQLP